MGSRSISGFGLIEIMITTAIMALVSLALLSMFSQATISQGRLSETLDWDEAGRSLSLLLSKSDQCRCNLISSGAFPDPVSPGFQISLEGFHLYQNPSLNCNAPGPLVVGGRRYSFLLKNFTQTESEHHFLARLQMELPRKNGSLVMHRAYLLSVHLDPLSRRVARCNLVESMTYKTLDYLGGRFP